ncbi:hypothetical protein [Methyloceanibacter caenitepidi]|uniref:Uncharacterized protein n=1 Tax=Methyloceanibacter caenitepidi TaxID=1384459 RepID=A0A0A8K625_9HYPH|nr:hypothetical protein [Methyloceanibacter caenitepidi]BAQ18363.1 hypothetical protein GL4_2931 [Methyloceanibacter caenitepidi]
MTTTVDPENSAAKTTRPEDERIEGTVFTPRQVGMLKIAVVVMGILLLAGFAAVIAGLIYQASKVGKKVPAEATVAAPPPDPVAMERAASSALQALSIPGDGEVVSMSLDGQRLALYVRSREEAEIVVVDLTTGKVVSRVKIDKDAPPAQ